MRFRKGARLDTGQVQDARGGRGLAVGGGAAGLVVIVVLALLGVDVTGGGDPYSLGTEDPASDLSATCRTGSDANQRDDCRIAGVVNSAQGRGGVPQAETRASVKPRRGARPRRDRLNGRAREAIYEPQQSPLTHSALLVSAEARCPGRAPPTCAGAAHRRPAR